MPDRNNKVKDKKFKIALALGGGGVRGLSHIGVLEVLEKSNIIPNLIVGTSIGALVGAGYALLKDVAKLKEKAFQIIEKSKIYKLEFFINKSFSQDTNLAERFMTSMKNLYIGASQLRKKNLLNNRWLERVIYDITYNKRFCETKIPFACVACDLNTGQEIIFKEGELFKPILASCAIPGIFSPVEYKDRYLVDGGILSLVPVQQARKLGADFIIAVNIEGKILKRNFLRGIDIIFQTDEIRGNFINRINLSFADFTIQPKVQHISWAEFSKASDCIEEGFKETVSRIEEIERRIKKAKIKWYMRKCIPF